ncbi:unnamed protein product [Orchesella dallaii]|uniref:UDP-glucuronosyltransferase n=1 Tax=Orchesella dallaii TaxID=48710 RepID=A0ABP1QN79_9HEXA
MGFTSGFTVALAAFLLFAAIPVSSHNILFLMPIATKSETHLLIPLAKQMLERGHNVTFVSPSTSSIQHKNLKEIIPVTPLTMADFMPNMEGDVLDMRRSKDDAVSAFTIDMSYMTDRCHATYQHKDFQPLLQAKAGSFDLVLVSAFFSECFLGLIYKMDAPHIQISSMPPPQYVNDVTGLRTPLSFVPNPFVEFTDKMTLSQRLGNAFSSWMFSLVSYHHFFKVAENIYKQYLGEDLPDVDTLRKNVSLIFSNTHFSLNFPRPLMPDVIEIGGMHCHPPEPLPKELEDFVSGDENGFIFFSLGTVFLEGGMPQSLVNTFINVFSRLKLRVLWKWRSGNIEGLPSNVKVSKWLPQNDLLGHPNIKLFISHGGLLSTQESTYHGVPVIGIPLFVDQDVNMKQAEAHGYALKLELLDITEEYLENAIHRMLNDTSFTKNAKLASQIFKDQAQTPLERAVYWMDYIIKYKGAPHLRSSARDLSYIEYHMLDVQLIFMAILGTIVLIAWKIISYILHCNSKDSDVQDVKRKKKRN